MKQENMSSQNKWRNVILLFISQALYQACSILSSTLSGIVGLELTANKSLATLPVAMVPIGAALMMIPVSILIRKLGAKQTFMLGTTLGIIAGLLAFYSIIERSFSLFIIGNLLVGCYQSFAQYYRFTAADSVDTVDKGKAISFVIAGGVVAAILGPNLAKYTQGIGTVPFAISYLCISVLSIIALLFLFFLKFKHSLSLVDVETKTSTTPLKTLIKQKSIQNAVIYSSVSYYVMIMIMAGMPLAMRENGFEPGSSATVMQCHVLGMFLPSFFTGFIIKRIGLRKVILLGILFFVVNIFFSITGSYFYNYLIGLIFLGIGWNFMFVGGSTLLVKSYAPKDKEKVQAFHDFTVFLIISLSSLSVGWVLEHSGWITLNLLTIPLLLIATLVLRSKISHSE